MPQPLSRVKRDAPFYLTSRIAVHKYPELVAKVGHAISLAAHIENLYSGILTTMLGAQAKPAAAMLRSLNSLGVKSQAVMAASEAAFDGDPERLDLFTAIAGQCDAAAVHRHRFVHWAWALCDEVPESLLFIDPKALLAHEAGTAGFIYPTEGRSFGFEEDDFDKRGVLVYRKPALDRAVASLEIAHDRLSAFRLCVMPNAKAHKIHEPIYRRLLSAPELAPRLEKLRAQRKNTPAE